MGYLRYAIKGLNPKSFYYLTSTSFKDSIKKHNPIYPNKIHVKAAMQWLRTAQRKNGDGGVSALYSLFEGWSPSYIETTGYIIPTFFNYALTSKEHIYWEIAIEMADFELRNQLSSGAFPGDGKKHTPVIFNTGQVIFGLCRTYEETQDEKYRKSAEKAANWLLSVIDSDGCWRKNLYLNQIHTYNVRTAWSLLYVHKITNKGSYKKTAVKNLDWAFSQQLENGWIKNNSFHPGQEPLLHTIAYSIRGLLEASIYLKDDKYLGATVKSSDAIMQAQRSDGSLPGSFNKEWKSSVAWSCLTGNSQMSIIWQKLFMITKNNKFMDATKKINSYMKTTQNIASQNLGIKGGIQGAFPIYGWYAPFCFPNWAAKFFVDSLMLEDNPKLAEKLA